MAHRQPPDELAIVAVVGVLGGYRDEARSRLAAVLDSSVEDLHQFRVAMRRARSVVGVAKGVLPEESRVALGRSLRAMSRLTSAPRDLDVFIGDLPGLAAEVDGGDDARASTPGADPEALAALVDIASAARERPAVSLEWALRGPDGARMFELWDSASTAVPAGGGAPGPLATERAIEVVDTWTMKSYRRSRKRGRAAVRSDDLEHWHDLRKSLKKLRYLITSFDYLHERKRVKAVRKPLKALQEHIGGLQDCRVQADLLTEMRERATAAHLQGAVQLASAMSEGVGRRLERVHAECTEAWLEFDTPATQEHFDALTAHRS